MSEYDLTSMSTGTTNGSAPLDAAALRAMILQGQSLVNSIRGDLPVPTKFQIGDYVTIKKTGITGRIMSFNSGNVQPYAVAFESGEAGTYTVSDLDYPSSGSVEKKSVSFDSVILPTELKSQIEATISRHDNHDKIYKEWGFDSVIEKGKAISMLFYGLPGTGKTLMAQAIADKYKLELQIIETASIETPEPGGAERNIKSAFEKAHGGKAVILIDECDSLITDRSRVGMILAAQINSLLTALERHEGIVIFTTNRLGALDPAFERRLSLKVEFPMPNAEYRAKIWQRMFPAACPLEEGINWDALADVEIAGGHIKNVVLAAASTAAYLGHDKITEEVIWDQLDKEVDALRKYQGALKDYNPYYGTPVAGGQGGGLTRGRHAVAIAKDTTRG